MCLYDSIKSFIIFGLIWGQILNQMVIKSKKKTKSAT